MSQNTIPHRPNTLLNAMASDQHFTESELVEKARSGDQEAFSELVRRYRAEALGLAHTLTRDSYMAEDIVQEALVRAFLHLGTLMDSGRFRPWLKRIVRNQAYMKLRRGGLYRKEQPFSGYGSNYGASGTGSRHSGGTSSADWSDVDRILFQLTSSAVEEVRQSNDPADIIVRHEMLHNLRLLLHCLTKREKSIFEAHFFGELPPAEIAKLFGTTTANVYTSLSRSRSKVQKERIIVSIQGHIQSRASLGLPRRRILPSPPRL